jgi:hypothetical protein
LADAEPYTSATPLDHATLKQGLRYKEKFPLLSQESRLILQLPNPETVLI